MTFRSRQLILLRITNIGLRKLTDNQNYLFFRYANYESFSSTRLIPLITETQDLFLFHHLTLRHYDPLTFAKPSGLPSGGYF